jgi:hypothetical protein
MGQGHSQAKVAVAFPFLKSPSCESHRCEFTRKMGKMISTANQEQVKDFFDVVREKHGVKAEDYCRTWIETNTPREFNPEGLICEWRRSGQLEEMRAFREAAEVRTSSRMEIS